MQTISNDLANGLAERAIERCAQLAKISESPEGTLRQYLSDQHKVCNQQVAAWMTLAGMETWQDEVGNQWGRLPSMAPDAKRLIIGSHLDTVPNAGAYDGTLGVILAIEVAHQFFQQAIDLPFHLDIVGFCDEEGTRFATTLIGSKAMAGNFDESWLALKDCNEITMSEAMKNFGLTPESYSDAALNRDEVLEFWEAHIEQGPVLEDLNQPIGVVTAIAGSKRAKIGFLGKAGHAGTTPMYLRSDALAAASEFIIQVEKLAGECNNNQVATVGNMAVSPGATNVIAGSCEISLDVRAQSDAELENLIFKLQNAAQDTALRRQIKLEWCWVHQAETVECAPKIRELFATAATANGYEAPRLPSGAGHDAMAVAGLCPVGMLFIRSPDGLSHHPDETVILEDVAAAIRTLFSALSSYLD